MRSANARIPVGQPPGEPTASRSRKARSIGAVTATVDLTVVSAAE
jgi:hypothetical protein